MRQHKNEGADSAFAGSAFLIFRKLCSYEIKTLCKKRTAAN